MKKLMAQIGPDLENSYSFFHNGTNLVLCSFRGWKSYIHNNKSEKFHVEVEMTQILKDKKRNSKF